MVLFCSVILWASLELGTANPKLLRNFCLKHYWIRLKREMLHFTPIDSPGRKLSATPVQDDASSVVDFLKGFVMIVLSLGYANDYFRPGYFLNQSFDPTQAELNVFLKWITTYAAPVFIFLTGISAWLNSAGNSKSHLSRHLFKRGLLFVCAEFFVSAIGNGFNPSYPSFHLQVIWTAGVSMIALSVLVRLSKSKILLIGMLAIAVPLVLQSLNTGEQSILVSAFNPAELVLGRCSIILTTPVIPSIGLMAIGYYVGNFYRSSYLAEMRKTALLFMGVGAIAIFFALRISDPSESAYWSGEANAGLGILLFFDVTNHSSPILYSLITIGPALVFLATFEKPLNKITRQVASFGRLSLYYFVVHIFLLHLFAESGKVMAAYLLPELVSTYNSNKATALQSHGAEFSNVYFLWIAMIVLLYACRKWTERCKKDFQCTNELL